ncbi:hypothetical protein HXX76_004001 [Chlamydomonas incerta]|uniref:Uncharacterized protein n=1 Tax=Chlamydomonas incerta TaxID=51695 RepID=A0A835W8C9_CHLIN|nr:hypothetical protein HXX76_004001 [Chlamydomonas incerta]|eukprot:KAG2441149.1 hypothetical protein HXX76_004001 [Chlamydomonas incerta]
MHEPQLDSPQPYDDDDNSIPGSPPAEPDGQQHPLQGDISIVHIALEEALRTAGAPAPAEYRAQLDQPLWRVYDSNGSVAQGALKRWWLWPWH